MIRRLVAAALIAAAVFAPVAAMAAASLQIAKSSSVVADQVSTLNPHALPGSDIDYTLLVTNPVDNATLPVRRVVIVDAIPDAARLRVTDYGASGSGPIGFADGSLLGVGLLGSGLSYGFAGLANGADGLEFSDGVGWTYVPVADANGFDARVRAVRITLTGTHATGTSFRLRYRVRLK